MDNCRLARRRPMTGEPGPAEGPRVWRVSDLNRRVRGLLDADQALADVWVEGEVSGPSYPPLDIASSP